MRPEIEFLGNVFHVGWNGREAWPMTWHGMREWLRHNGW